jgi:molecular chaperone GrpE
MDERVDERTRAKGAREGGRADGEEAQGSGSDKEEAQGSGSDGADAAGRAPRADARRGESGRSPEAMAEHAVEEELGQQLDSLQSEFGALNDRHLRLAAEFQNYRRRAESEMTEAWSRAQSDLVRRFLDVLDDLQRVAELDPTEESASVESIVEGIDLVERKFVRALEDAGVEVIDPAGARFDPETMEAMLRVPAKSAEEDDLVQDVFQNGYRLKGHLIRPARVSVKKHE